VSFEMMTPVSRLGLLVNFTRPRVREGLEMLLAAAREAGITLLAPPETAAVSAEIVPCDTCAFESLGAQGVISLGGDGSFLAATHTLAGATLPLIGLNIGHLGYLTAVNEEGFGPMLADLAAGNYILEERATLASIVQTSAEASITSPDALNDVVLSRAEGGSAIAICLELNGCPVARWMCDGVILSTPTGSTAYSLSVGGPVVVPSAGVTGINVIAPHTLSARPLIVPDTTKIVLRIEGEQAAAMVYADGVRQGALTSEGRLGVTRSNHVVRVMVPNNGNPYLPLSRKLRWGEAFVR
jgi:NAD+ kinase